MADFSWQRARKRDLVLKILLATAVATVIAGLALVRQSYVPMPDPIEGTVWVKR